MRNHLFNEFIIQQQKLIAYACDLITYEICYMTETAKALYDIHDEQAYLGQKCYELLQGMEGPCPFCTNSKLAPGEIYKWEHYNKKLQKWLAVDDTLMEYQGKHLRFEIARDITEQKNRLDQVSNRLTIEETLVECIQTLSGEGDVTEAMNRFLEMIGAYYIAERAYIFEFDFDNQTIDNTFEWCAPGVTQEMDFLQGIPIAYVREWIEKFEQQGEFFITSLQREVAPDTPEYRILHTQNIESLAAAPLKKNNRIIGFLGVDNPVVNTDDLSLLRNVSSFVLDEMERRRLILELERSSYTDFLTGLKNRNCYISKLNELHEQLLKAIGVIYIDINGMKKLNDSYGHEYGDGIIRKTADIIQYHAKDECYRVGGDEFVVLCVNIEQDRFQELVAGLRSDFDSVNDCDVSIGCTWKGGAVSVNEEILRADDLMYAEKQDYYHSVLCQGRDIRTGMATEVLQEISDKQFVVYYQPQVELKTGKIIGAEALVRKRDKSGRLLPPVNFIPYYEQEGIISHVDLFVLSTVCATLQKWKSQGIETNIAINISRATLMTPSIVKRIKEICQNYEVSPQQITIEVTESISKVEHQQLLDLIQSLAMEGFPVALDDFGSEYSNLSILTAMNFQKVKFDKSLVEKLETNDQCRIVMKHALKICNELSNTRSLAEGIETKKQLELLLQYQCDYGQGYYFGKPMSSDMFCEILKKEEAQYASI